jgi:small-conductance mechanosensitive channel
MNSLDKLLNWLNSILEAQLFHLGGTDFKVQTLLLLLVSLFLLLYLTGKFKKLLVKNIFPRYNLDIGVSQSIATIIRYILVILGLLIIFQTSGIDLSALGLLFGALGIGIGFGLQNITNNLISGIIILFERPVKVGDRIEVDDLSGNIVNISARATTIITNDNIAIIIPNSDLISSKVINWSHNNRSVRFNFPVGVSYREDPEKIRKLLLEVAKANPGVLDKPPPDVLFENFGESSLDFNLRVWTDKFSDTPRILKSQLYYAIFKKFKENNIEIPYPQRDVHIKNGPEGEKIKTD